MKDIPTEIHILASSNMVERTEKEFILGKMEKFMMVNGIKDSNRVMEYGKVYTMIHILVNGKIQKHMDTEFILGQMVINTKVNGICA